MSYRPIVMSTTIQADPAGAFAELLKAFRKHRGDRAAVAAAYDVDPNTVRRWVKRLASRGHDLQPAIEGMTRG